MVHRLFWCPVLRCQGRRAPRPGIIRFKLTKIMMHRYIVRGPDAKMTFPFRNNFKMSKFAVLVGTLLVATLGAPGFNPQLILHAAPAPIGKADDGKVF